MMINLTFLYIIVLRGTFSKPSESKFDIGPTVPKSPAGEEKRAVVGWLGGVVVRTLDLRLSITGSIHDTARLFLRQVTAFRG